MEKEKLKEELDHFFRDYEKKFPSWFKEQRESARALFWKMEEEGYPVGRFGEDFNLLDYLPHASIEHEKRESLLQLSEEEREIAELAGQNIDEKERLGSKLQEDATTTYMSVTEDGKKFLSLYPEGVVVEDIEDAVIKYPWIQKFLGRIHPQELDKYTAYNIGYSRGGVFVWVKKGVKVELPIQACFFVKTSYFAQLPRILVILEPYSSLHVISGCVRSPGCGAGIHGCVTEIYIGEGAQMTYSMIHNFGASFHIRPKIGAVVEKDARYIENFIVLGECISDQAYPTAVLRGEGASAVIRCIMLCLGKSKIDVGSCIIFTAPNTSAELISRAVIADEAQCAMRGNLKGYAKGIKGHLECRGILLSEAAKALAFPSLRSTDPEAALTHEAAVGKIKEEELCYLMSRGLSQEEATSLIVRGFLDITTPGFPKILKEQINKVIEQSVEKVL